MADGDKKKNEYGIVPNDVSSDQATHDLLLSMHHQDGGSFLLSNPSQDPDLYSRNELQPIKHRQENGVWIITYDFETTAKYTFDRDYHPEREDESDPLDAEERAAVRQVMDEIERVANVQFVENGTINSGEEEERNWSDFYITKYNDSLMLLAFKENYRGSFNSGYNEISLHEDRAKNKSTISHELCHALGISHPGESMNENINRGDNPLYNKDATTMSYNEGDSRVKGLGAFDVAALQAVYGKPKPRPDEPDTLHAEDLKDTKYIFKQKPFTLDLSDKPLRGDLTVDMEKGIEGYLMDKNFNPEGRVKLLFTPDTELKDVIPGKNLRLSITGNDKPNHLRGGDSNDTLVARGGGDMLTGRDGADRFIFDGKSGFGNIITDLEIIDRIVLKSPIAGVELEPRDGRNTLLTARNAAGESVASAYILNASPEQVSEHLLQTAANTSGLIVNMAPAATGTVPVDDMPSPPATPAGSKNPRTLNK